MKSENILKVNGREQKVISEIIDKKIWFKIDEKTFSYDLIELSQSSFTKNKSHAKSPDKITAPMPGKMTKVFIKEGQTVKKGDPLIVMEAMKMEYTLKSDIDAVVEKVYVQVQEQVTLGHLLVQLKVLI